MASDVPSSSYEWTECRAIGTVASQDVQTLQDLLKGLSGSSGEVFNHYEIVLGTDDQPPATVRLMHPYTASGPRPDAEPTKTSCRSAGLGVLLPNLAQLICHCKGYF